MLSQPMQRRVCGILLLQFLLLLVLAGCPGPAAADITGGSIDKDGIRVQSDDGNPFYYEECSVSVSLSLSGVKSGCSRVWKPLFYVCAVGGGLVGLLLITGCCCCCCCAPCKSNGGRYYHPQAAAPNVIVMSQPVPAANVVGDNQPKF